MNATTALARGGIGGGNGSAMPQSMSKKSLKSTAAGIPNAAAPSPSSSLLLLLSPRRRNRCSSAAAVSTSALKGSRGQDLAREPRFQQQKPPQRLSPFALATAGLLSTAPAALRASDSDDPSSEDDEEEEEEEEDDPASELTAEELAMAFSEDIKPKEEEEEEEEKEEEVEEAEFDLAVAAAAAASTTSETENENEEDDARSLALELARVAADTKASDVVVLHVAPLVYWTSYMVLCTVYSRPQLGAVLAKSEQAAAGDRFGRDLGGSRGAGRSPWEVLDFGDVVMHCFTPDQREFYDLEGFYGAAEEVELPSEVSGGAAGGAGRPAGKRDASSWANRA